MRYKHGNSVCISSQVGCKMGCRFCASTIGGWTRNLTPAEMLEQIYRIQKNSGERVSNVVVMGTGEPLDNYDTLLRFIHMISMITGFISAREILRFPPVGSFRRWRLGRGKAADHTGFISPCIQSGEAGRAYAHR